MAFNTPSIYSKLLTSPKKPDEKPDKATNELQMKLSKQLADELTKKGGTLKGSTPPPANPVNPTGPAGPGSGIKRPPPVPPKRSTSPTPNSINPSSPLEQAKEDMMSPREGEGEAFSVEKLITTLIGDWDISTLGDGKEEVEDDLKLLLLQKLGD
eukprot:TRINITY_DN760_c0_g1_i4.p3 TRINITY_DN760_c0_g1~~TRINITY_DN760_c0_g1_i4.p3  ORF type:complete len:155 (-),score=62.15 TRINITY_DN760_c0_g1_i4:268-732(-)